jgi:hypothetical protein
MMMTSTDAAAAGASQQATSLGAGERSVKLPKGANLLLAELAGVLQE